MILAPRRYRHETDTRRWRTCRVREETSDLYIRSSQDVENEARAILRMLREEIRGHIDRQFEFHTSLTPVPPLPHVPPVIAMMYEASERAGVGPMAAVAGAIAECIGGILQEQTEEIIIENGGDIWLRLTKPASVAIFPGGIHFGTIPLLIRPERTPCGVCTSSARTGHSFSFGRADAATVIAPSAALADALATETCNRVRCADDMEKAARFAIAHGADGVVIVLGERLVALGGIEFTDAQGVTA